MKIHLAFIYFLFIIFCKLHAQQINILNVEKKFDTQGSYLKISCQLLNTSDKEIILPLQIEDLHNDFTSYYKIETIPGNVFYRMESIPFPLNTQYPQLSKRDLLICKPKSSINFVLETNKITDEGLKMDDNKKLKKIKVVYEPFIIHNREKFLDDEIKNTQFFDKKIQSAFFKINI